jgi:RNA polymerase subunit RPABC4/transcription elongation factor Spt4
MPKELQGVTDAIGSIVDSPLVQLGFRALAVYWIVFWLAAAYWAFRDLQLRTDNPVMPYLAAAFVILFTPVLFPAAIVIYRTIRPHEKIDEVYERTLAEEAMLAEIETVRHCPACRRRVHEDWIICPACRTRLARVCPNCSRLVGLDWSLCAWCGRDFERREVGVPAAALVSHRAAVRVSAVEAGAIAGPEPARAAIAGPEPARTAMAGPEPARAPIPSATPARSGARPSPRPAGARPDPNRATGRPAPGSLPER